MGPVRRFIATRLQEAPAPTSSVPWPSARPAWAPITPGGRRTSVAGPVWRRGWPGSTSLNAWAEPWLPGPSEHRGEDRDPEHSAEEPQHVERAGCLADFVGCTQPMTAFWAAGMTIETPTPAPISGATSLGKVIRVLSLRCQDSVRELSQSQTRSALLQVWVYRPSDTNYSDTSASPPPWRSEQRRQRTTLSPWCVCGTLPSGPWPL